MAQSGTRFNQILGPSVNFQETNLGFEYKTTNFFAFFGKKDSSVQNLKAAYPQFNFKSLHQVHGNEIVETTEDSLESIQADAHWTGKKKLALVVKSADCIPVLAYSREEKIIFAIHAGWRGVQNQIIPKTLTKLDSHWEILIGPHITKDSFEIKKDCLDLLKIGTSLPEKDWHQNNRADLLKIVKTQIKEASPTSTLAPNLILDTKTDLRFHSHRRDQATAGRQNSFIVML